MTVHPLFDARTWTLTYVVWDEATRDAVIIDPVLDFDPANGRVWEESNEKVVAYVEENKLQVKLILETHAHADHLTGAQGLKERFGVPVGIGAAIQLVQKTFKPVFGMGEEVAEDGSQFDLLLEDGQEVSAGSLTIRALHTPGHTPACMSFLIGDALFSGDALFLPDSGVGRCDFPKGDAEALYTSVHEKLYSLPDDTRVFVGHDYQPNGRPVAWETTIGASKASNIHLQAATSSGAFVAFRKGRDKTLAAPRLLLPSIQVNIDAGRLPVDANGKTFLKIPLKRA